MRKDVIYIITISVVIALLFIANIAMGAVDIPLREVFNILIGQDSAQRSWQYIVLESRLPQAIAATLCGASLAVCGLMLQTVFRNPLAGPSVFGINSGASLGVALVMLLFGGGLTISSVSVTGFIAVLIAAFAGAMVVMAVILFISTIIRNSVMLLIIGIMIGYISSSVISLLNFFSTEERVQSYLIWGMGNFGGVSSEQIPVFSCIIIICIILSLLLVKPLNALLLGEQYAENLGINTTFVRNYMLVITGLQTAVTTAFCGPIAFIGLAVPHMARLILATDNHIYLMPMTLLTGAATALLCNLICILPGNSVLPLNAITPIIGAPIIIYVILKNRR